MCFYGLSLGDLAKIKHLCYYRGAFYGLDRVCVSVGVTSRYAFVDLAWGFWLRLSI